MIRLSSRAVQLLLATQRASSNRIVADCSRDGRCFFDLCDVHCMCASCIDASSLTHTYISHVRRGLSKDGRYGMPVVLAGDLTAVDAANPPRDPSPGHSGHGGVKSQPAPGLHKAAAAGSCLAASRRATREVENHRRQQVPCLPVLSSCPH